MAYDKDLAALKISDQAFGTHAAVTLEKTHEIDAATTAFYNSPQKEADKVAYLQRLDDVKAKYAETDASISADELKIQELQEIIASLTGTTVYIDTVHRDIYDPTHYTGKGGTTTTTPKPHVGPGGMAGGADFIVPPGYPNDSYPLNVSSGEHVVVTNNNQVSNYNLNIHSNSNTEIITPGLRNLKSMAGLT